MFKRKIGFILVLILLLSVFTSTYASDKSKSKEQYQLGADFHTNFEAPFLVDAYVAQQYPLSSVSGADIIAQLPEGAKAQVVSDGYGASIFSQMGLIPDMSEYDAVKKCNNYAALQQALYPDKLIVYAGVLPNRPYTMDEIKRCHEQLKLPGLKVYLPNSGLDLSQQDSVNKLKEIFSYCEKHEVPIILHQRGGTDEVYGKDEAAELLNIIFQYPDLRIQISHMGGYGGLKKPTIDWLTEAVELLSKNPKAHVYLCTSATIITENDHPILYAYHGATSKEDLQSMADLIRKIGTDKIVYGTDYPIFNYRDKTHLQSVIENLPLNSKELKSIFKNTPEKTLFKGIKINLPTVEYLDGLGITQDNY